MREVKKFGNISEDFLMNPPLLKYPNGLLYFFPMDRYFGYYEVFKSLLISDEVTEEELSIPCPILTLHLFE